MPLALIRLTVASEPKPQNCLGSEDQVSIGHKSTLSRAAELDTFVDAWLKAKSPGFLWRSPSPCAVALGVRRLRRDSCVDGIKSLFTMIAHRVGSVVGASPWITLFRPSAILSILAA